jgi:hypothetical protein
MTKTQFIERLKEYNENALYFLTFQVNLSKTKVCSIENSIDRIFAICPVKQTIYIENYDIEDVDNMRDINFSDIDKYMTENEMSQVLLLMQKRLYHTSYLDFIYKYEQELLERLSMKDFSNEDELNEVCLAIQKILKVTYGDNAGMFFSDAARKSATLTQTEKRNILIEYIETELDSLCSTNLILTVAVEVEYIEDFDIDDISIEDIIFSNKEILNVSTVNCDIVEEV